MSPTGGSKDPPEKNMTLTIKKGKKKRQSADMTTPIFCSKCLSVSFVRDHPAQKCCPECRALTKGTQRDEPEKMELEEVSGDEYETISEVGESSDESPESIKKLKTELAKRAQQIKELEKQVIELKLIIANKFINEQTANQSQGNLHQMNQQIPGDYRARASNAEKPLYANVVKGTCPTGKAATRALILKMKEPPKGENAKIRTDEIKQRIRKSLPTSEINFTINSIRVNERDEVIMVLPTKEDQANALSKLTEKESTLGLTVKPAKRKLPRLMIQGIPAYIDPEELVGEILLLNEEIDSIYNGIPESTFRLITLLNSRNPQYKNAVIETTPMIRKIIMQTGRIKFGFAYLPVRDHVHVVQCSICQRYGHRHGPDSPCKAEKPTCGICSANHLTTNCPIASETTDSDRHQRRCSNCNASGHGAIERSRCDSHAYYKQLLFSRIDFSDD